MIYWNKAHVCNGFGSTGECGVFAHFLQMLHTQQCIQVIL